MMKLDEIGAVKMCKRIMKHQTETSGDVPFYKIGTFGKEPDAFISQEVYDEYRAKYPFPKKGDVLISAAGTIGRTVVYDGKPAYFQDSNIVWIENDEKKITNEYLRILLQSIKWRTVKGGTIERLYNDIIRNTEIVTPPLEIQKQYIADFANEQKVIATNRSLIDLMADKIQNTLAEVWNG
jgi:type I restriction enzyme S subunit